MSLLIYGAIGLGLLCMMFILHELRNAPYEDALDPERVLSEIDRQKLIYRPWD